MILLARLLYTRLLLQKKAIRVLYSKTPIAHTAPLYIKMKQPKLSDL